MVFLFCATRLRNVTSSLAFATDGEGEEGKEEGKKKMRVVARSRPRVVVKTMILIRMMARTSIKEKARTTEPVKKGKGKKQRVRARMRPKVVVRATILIRVR